jgi:hypothetical protein
MIRKDGVKKWHHMLEPMVKWMNSKNEVFMVAGLDSFCVIFEQCDEDIHILVPNLMKALYDMFTKPDVLAFLIFFRFWKVQGKKY